MMMVLQKWQQVQTIKKRFVIWKEKFYGVLVFDMFQKIFLDDDGITKVTTSADNKKTVCQRKGKMF